MSDRASARVRIPGRADDVVRRIGCRSADLRGGARALNWDHHCRESPGGAPGHRNRSSAHTAERRVEGQRLPNGNTYIAEDNMGRLFQVKPDGEIVWEYVNRGGTTRPSVIPYDFTTTEGAA